MKGVGLTMTRPKLEHVWRMPKRMPWFVSMETRVGYRRVGRTLLEVMVKYDPFEFPETGCICPAFWMRSNSSPTEPT